MVDRHPNFIGALSLTAARGNDAFLLVSRPDRRDNWAKNM